MTDVMTLGKLDELWALLNELPAVRLVVCAYIDPKQILHLPPYNDWHGRLTHIYLVGARAWRQFEATCPKVQHPEVGSHIRVEYSPPQWRPAGDE